MNRYSLCLLLILSHYYCKLWGQNLNLIDKVLPEKNIDIWSKFGQSIALEGDIAVVGMPYSGNNLRREGSVFIYQKIDDKWAKLTELVSPDPQSNAQFGSMVAIDEGVIVVSAPQQGGLAPSEGALFIYERKEDSWDGYDHVATLTSSEPQRFAQLGENLAFDNGVIVASSINFDSVGVLSAGRVLVFEEPTEGWGDMNQSANLYSSIPASGGTSFGYSVDIQGDTIAVGARYSPVGDADHGIVFLYFKNKGASWKSGSESDFVKGHELDWQYGEEIILSGKRLIVATSASGEKRYGPPFVYVY